MNLFNIYYDQSNKRLVYLKEPASEDFWDRHWHNNFSTKVFSTTHLPSNDYLLNVIKKYMLKGHTILEGGCGPAHYSHYFTLMGFKSIALDFAPQTIEKLQKIAPHISPILADVRDLPMQDNAIDGYCSLGVIEHFYEGYEKIISEAMRVIKAEGYLFLTFPTMSVYRRLRALLNLYPIWEQSENLSHFYQFALDEYEVKEILKKYNFRVIRSVKVNGLKGLKENSAFISSVINRIYALNNKYLNKILWVLDTLFLSKFCNHILLLVCQNKKPSEE